jgi:hypothetical protein
MDYIKSLEADLEKGYSKSDLEKLIGLPKNNLSGILKGDRKLSKKSQLKIDKWNKSEKPHPLSVYWNIEQKDVLGDTFKTTKEEFKKVANDIFEGGIAITKSDLDGNIKRIDPIGDEGYTAQRIAEIEKMLLMPQKYLPYNKRTPLEAELNQLKFKLQKTP